MTKLTVTSDVSERLKAFINSDLFDIRSDGAKSEYWKLHSDLLHATVDGESVEVTGNSGFYLPEQSSTLGRTALRVLRAASKPSKVARWVKHQVASRLQVPRMMTYGAAFDAVMGHAEVADPDLSPFKVNHRKLAKLEKVFATAESVKAHYEGWSGYSATSNIINHCYYQNILRGFVADDEVRTVLEIGAGNGNFPSILYHDWGPLRVILVDLPETLAIAIPFLGNLFPKSTLVLPHEVGGNALPPEFDFAFLTVDQLDAIAESSVDLAINCHSFQEMTHGQIAAYFKLIQRACRESGWFFTANRVEKIPVGADAYTVEQLDQPNRFAEYPWNPLNEILVYEISQLMRLVQLDPVSIRLERVHK